MDMSSIQAAIGGLKMASDMTLALVDVRDAGKLREKTIELQQVILTAQSSGITAQAEQSELLDRIRSLQIELDELKAWNVEKERYYLRDLGQEQFVYELMEFEVDDEETPHKLCVTCFDVHSRRSVLQSEHHMVGRAESLYCPICKTDIYTRGFRDPAHRKR